MSKVIKTLYLEWDDDTEYAFYVLDIAREPKYTEEGKPTRNKSVYRGFFGEEAPEGVEPRVICWLKEIWFQEGIEYPQLREQYDLVEFPAGRAERIRQPLARNPDAVRITEEMKAGKRPISSGRPCYMVEQCYSLLKTEDIRYLTPWERLEYVYQYCAALNQLYELSPEVYAWPVEAHRDVKLENGLIQRDKDRFWVKLLDFSAVRFKSDEEPEEMPVMPEFLSDEGGQNTSPHLMSVENTCLEIVSSDYPTKRAADVYALGAMLAGMFAYVSPDCRNPNEAVCTMTGKNRLQWSERDKIEIYEIFRKGLRTDVKLGSDYRGTTWMEEMLRAEGIPFAWGDPKGSPYVLSQELLAQVKELVFLATRVDPDSRISFDEFCDGVRKLKRCVREERSGSSKLYLQPESICMIHQRDLMESRTLMRNAVEQALEQEDSLLPVQLCWYQNKTDKRYSRSAELKLASIYSAGALSNKVATQSYSDDVAANSMVHMLYKLWKLYERHKYENSFSGTIHIFSAEPITQEHFEAARSRTNEYTFEYVLAMLSKLSSDSLEVIFHTTCKPEYLEESCAFTFVPLPGYEEAPEHEIEQETEPAPESKPAPEPELDLVQLYLRGAESLFFEDENGRKVYVSRKKIRR